MRTYSSWFSIPFRRNDVAFLSRNIIHIIQLCVGDLYIYIYVSSVRWHIIGWVSPLYSVIARLQENQYWRSQRASRNAARPETKSQLPRKSVTCQPHCFPRLYSTIVVTSTTTHAIEHKQARNTRANVSDNETVQQNWGDIRSVFIFYLFIFFFVYHSFCCFIISFFGRLVLSLLLLLFFFLNLILLLFFRQTRRQFKVWHGSSDYSVVYTTWNPPTCTIQLHGHFEFTWATSSHVFSSIYHVVFYFFYFFFSINLFIFTGFWFVTILSQLYLQICQWS